MHAQTLVALRALARTKGVTNVSRYTKAALIEKIEQA
nr:Rho termination factor N-terminal domain-containing protein [Frigoribacterium sp. VKM Ac-2836]